MKIASVGREIIVAVLFCTAAISFAENGIDYNLFREQFDRLPLAELTARGWSNIKKERIDSAAAFYSIATSRYSESLSRDEMERCGIAFINTGYIWLFKRYNAEQAYPWLIKAAEIGERHNLPQVRIGAYDNLAKVYADYNNYQKAMELYKKAFHEAINEHFDSGVTMTFIDLATAARNSGHLNDIAEEIKALNDYDFGTSPLSSYCKYFGAGLERLVAGDVDDAVSMLDGGERLLDPVYERERYHTNHVMFEGTSLLAAGNTRKAIVKFRLGEELSAKYGLSDVMQTACNDLRQAYRTIGMTDSAHYYEYRALLLRDSLYTMSKYDIIKDIESAAALSGLRDDIRKSRIREEKQQALAIATSAGALVAILLLTWVYIKNRKLQRTNNELYRKNMEAAERRMIPCPPRDTKQQSNNDDKMRDILEKIYDILENSTEIFSHDFSLERMASLAQVKPQQVSQAIGDLTGKNLNTLLGEYRVREACRRLSDTSTYSRYTIESISESVGYRSRTHFSRVFKTVTGMTTTEFIRQAKNQSGRPKEQN